MAQLRSPRPALSEREHEILGQLARGLGNREIARALFISEATVKTHLGRIYAKLGVETRAGAVAVGEGAPAAVVTGASAAPGPPRRGPAVDPA